MVKDLKGVCPWISRHIRNFAYNKYVASKEAAFKERRYKRKFDKTDLGHNYWRGLNKI